jgi:hypothetical protein
MTMLLLGSANLIHPGLCPNGSSNTLAGVVIDIGPTGDENDRRVRQADRNTCCPASSNR